MSVVVAGLGEDGMELCKCLWLSMVWERMGWSSVNVCGCRWSGRGWDGAL